MMTNEKFRNLENDSESISGGAGNANVHPVINQGACIKCKQCRAACQTGAIEVTPSAVIVKKVLCNGCGDCASVCPATCITMV